MRLHAHNPRIRLHTHTYMYAHTRRTRRTHSRAHNPLPPPPPPPPPSMSQPGITGAVCTDKQGLALAGMGGGGGGGGSSLARDVTSAFDAAQGTLKPEAAGLIAGLASQAGQLKHGAGRDDVPTVVVEFDTGYININVYELCSNPTPTSTLSYILHLYHTPPSPRTHFLTP